ncbi:diguanylate cyclase domain-containing protein [Clostridium oceanicum]|uniref:Sensor domain-containing diguanylate cyclase n=1 Tax=Clostridium oceanicum TaxID=1543 RepID=A0ABP3UL69_9CLOT
MKAKDIIKDLSYSIMQKMGIAYCYCKIILNCSGMAEDIYILHSNEEFGKVTGLTEYENKNNLLRFTKYKLYLLDKLSNMIKNEQKEIEFEGYFDKTKKWGKLSIFIDNNEHLLITVYDITPYKNKELTLKIEEKKYKALINLSLEAIFIRDLEGRILYCNNAACDLFQYEMNEITKLNIKDLIPKDIELEENFFSLDSSTEKIHRKKDGTKFYSEEITKILEVEGKACIATYIRDITERKKTSDHTKHLAYFDSLTDLPNRNSFNVELKRELENIKESNNNLAVMFLDLDNFKFINDTFGHSIGDKLLCKAANRMKGVLRKEDLVARIGGDEFTILLKNVGSTKEAKNIVSRIIQVFNQPVYVENNIMNIKVSIGISFAPMHGSDAETLIQKADKAMYIAKRSHTSEYYVYDKVL